MSQMTGPTPNDTDAKVQYFLQTERFREYIEKEILDVIKTLLDKPDVDEKRIQAIAKHSLELLALGTAIDELYKAAIKLDQDFPELRPVVIKLMNEYEQKYNKKAVEQVSDLIKQGKYEDAQNVMLKVLEFKGA